MMSQDLVVVLTKVQRANGASASSSVRLRLFLPLLTALIVCGLTAGRADAQQAASSQTPQGTQSTPASAAEASHAATGPVVTYQHGQLTIVAENASLSQIMAALHTAMGTEVEIPAGSSTERVWAHLGPGSAHKILVDLFANTDLDYIIQGSSTDSGAIQSIALSLRKVRPLAVCSALLPPLLQSLPSRRLHRRQLRKHRLRRQRPCPPRRQPRMPLRRFPRRSRFRRSPSKQA
jgi:hypothetical protein